MNPENTQLGKNKRRNEASLGRKAEHTYVKHNVVPHTGPVKAIWFWLVVEAALLFCGFFYDFQLVFISTMNDLKVD